MFCFHLVDGYRCNPTTEQNQDQYCLCAQGKRISKIESEHMDNTIFPPVDTNEDRTWKLTCSEIKIPNSDKEFDATREKHRSGYRSKAQHQYSIGLISHC